MPNRMSEDIPKYISDRRSNKMPEDMLEYMSKNMSNRMSENIFLKYQKICQN